MSRLPLTFACAGYDRMQALMTGEVQPDGIDLNFIPVDNPRELFDRMMRERHAFKIVFDNIVGGDQRRRQPT